MKDEWNDGEGMGGGCLAYTFVCCFVADIPMLWRTLPRNKNIKSKNEGEESHAIHTSARYVA